MKNVLLVGLLLVGFSGVARADDAAPVFYLAPPGQWPGEIPAPILARELARQALLMSARDQFGLYTRDAVLREWTPDTQGNPPTGARGGPPGKMLVMDLRTTPDPGELCIWLNEPADHRQLLSQVIKAPASETTANSIPRLLEQIEPLAQNEFADQLRHLGYVPKSKPRCDTEIPQSVNRLLYQTTFFSNFSAVQQVHRSIREEGKSPARLSALVRGYANLGQLTSFQWSSIQKVMTARSLLYAQQMVSEDPDSAFSYYNRAYAFALTGLHAAALDDLSRADHIRAQHLDADGLPPRMPHWAEPLEAYCQFDLNALSAMGPKTDILAPLVALLVFTDVEHSGSLSELMQWGTAALDVEERCFRILDGMMVNGGFNSSREISERAPQVMLETLPAEIKLLPTVPETTNKALASAAGNDDHIANLTTVCRSFNKTGTLAEPSFALAGRILQETNYMHTMRSAAFTADQEKYSPKTFVDSRAPLVFDHPYRDYLDSLQLDAFVRGQQIRSMDVTDPQWQMFQMLSTLKSVLATPGRMNGDAGWRRIHLFPDPTGHDLEMALACDRSDEEMQQRIAPLLLQISPYSALAASTVVRLNFAAAEPNLTDWTQRFKDRPLFLCALANHWMQAGNSAAAESLLKHAVELAPDRACIEQLASVYLLRGDEAGWLSTMKKVLDAPDYRQDHGYAEAEIAWHYMHTGQFAAARNYADASVRDCGAFWAMLCDQYAAEYQGDLDFAEHMARQISQQYSPSSLLCFCQRTGKGNLPEGERLADLWIRQVMQRKATENFDQAGNALRLEGKDADARKVFEMSMRQEHSGYAGLELAMMKSQDGDTDGRIEALKFTAENCKTTIRQFDLHCLTAYAQLALDSGNEAPPIDQIEKLFATQHASASDRCAIYYFRGRQLQASGASDQASQSFQLAIQTPAITAASYTLACFELHKLGVAAPLSRPDDAMPAQAAPM
jgi:tetratricopeptide (TPR) repeat protein